MLRISPLLVLAGLASSQTASAQVVVGTAPVSGSIPTPPIFHLDLNTQTSTGPIWTDVSSSGMAADDAGGVMYTSVIDGSNNAALLYSWAYNDMNPPVLVGAITDTMSASLLRLEGLAWANGMLHAVQLSGATTGAPEAIFEIDVVNLTSTQVYVFPDVDINCGGLGHDPATGLFYVTNDGSGYAGGLGIVEVDAVNQTEALITGYPAGVTDVDGCTVDPAGRVFLVQDESAPLDAWDLNTNMYDPNPMNLPFTIADVHSGGAWAPGLTGGGSPGTNYCGPAVPNSSGQSGVISATGSATASDNDVLLTASDLPQNQFGYFLNSMTQAFVFPVPNSQGALCVGGQVGRYNATVFNTGSGGTGSLQLDLPNTPTPSGTVAIQVGETWNFTCWFRDNNPGPTSNFTDAVEIAFN